ncbi:MAG: outer membrane beta-barrel protein [Thermoguttaceae bacterium]|nr:outer membrane beta-barrel protein [Thermoguttaceae bacterium]
MTMKTKSFLRFAVLLSSMLAAGGSASWAGGFPHSALNSGFTAAEPGYAAAGAAGYQPVTMTSAEMPNCGSALSSALASPDMQYSGRPMGTAMASPAETGQSTAGKAKQGGEPLNDYFDSFEVAPPTGIGRGMVYAGEYYPGVSCFPATVQSGLLPAEAKTFGKLFFDGWATGSVFDHNEWPVTNGFDENTEGRNSSVSPYQLSQVYVTMGREVEYADHLSIGGRIDALYGTDYLLASSLGLETENVTALGAAASNVYISDPHWNKNSLGGHREYGLAVPQAYVEAYAPILSGFIAKVGHFYSPMGYESICSPNNFFHTHSYTKLYGQPQTVTGATGKLRLNPVFSVIGGAHQGWNVFDDNNASWDMIGGIALEGAQGDSLTFIVSTGDAVIDNWRRPCEHEFDSIDGRQTSYSLVLEKHLCPEVTWVLEHDLGIAEEGAYSIDPRGRKIREDARWYSVVNYLYFALDPTLELGARAEWFCDNGRSRLLAGEPTLMQKANIGYQWTGENVFDISLGLNWRPTPFLTVRPEVRWDYSDIEQTDSLGNTLAKGIYDNFTDDNRLTFGGDVILHF